MLHDAMTVHRLIGKPPRLPQGPKAPTNKASMINDRATMSENIPMHVRNANLHMYLECVGKASGRHHCTTAPLHQATRRTAVGWSPTFGRSTEFINKHG